jgi:hypothetical protein
MRTPASPNQGAHSSGWISFSFFFSFFFFLPTTTTNRITESNYATIFSDIAMLGSATHLQPSVSLSNPKQSFSCQSPVNDPTVGIRYEANAIGKNYPFKSIIVPPSMTGTFDTFWYRASRTSQECYFPGSDWTLQDNDVYTCNIKGYASSNIIGGATTNAVPSTSTGDLVIGAATGLHSLSYLEQASGIHPHCQLRQGMPIFLYDSTPQLQEWEACLPYDQAAVNLPLSTSATYTNFEVPYFFNATDIKLQGLSWTSVPKGGTVSAATNYKPPYTNVRLYVPPCDRLSVVECQFSNMVGVCLPVIDANNTVASSNSAGVTNICGKVATNVCNSTTYLGCINTQQFNYNTNTSIGVCQWKVAQGSTAAFCQPLDPNMISSSASAPIYPATSPPTVVLPCEYRDSSVTSWSCTFDSYCYSYTPTASVAPICKTIGNSTSASWLESLSFDQASTGSTVQQAQIFMNTTLGISYDLCSPLQAQCQVRYQTGTLRLQYLLTRIAGVNNTAQCTQIPVSGGERSLFF